MPGKLKRSLVTILKCGAALLVSMALWEGILRCTISTPIPYHHDERFGWMPQPHSAGIAAIEGRSYLQFNELGFRDTAMTPPQTAQIRVLCLGDSYTVGAQMDVQKTYPRLLQTFFAQKDAAFAQKDAAFAQKDAAFAQKDAASARRVSGLQNAPLVAAPESDEAAIRVFNAGRDGTTLAFPIGLADSYKSVFRPDWTVVQVRDGWGEIFNPEQEVHVVRDNNNFRTETQWHWKTMSPMMKRLIRWHIRDFALFQYGKFHYDVLKQASAVPVSKPKATSTNSAAEQLAPIQTAQSKAAQQPSVIAWSLARLKRAYPNLIVVHIPYGSPSHGGLLPPSIEESELLREGRQQRIPVIAMRPIFERDVARSHLVPIGFANTVPWSGHPNSRAHALVARALYNYLAPRITPNFSAANHRNLTP